MRRNANFVRMGVVAAAAMAASVAVSVPANAQPSAKLAPTCYGWLHSNDSPKWDLIADPGNLKVGPYAVCGNVRYLSAGTKVYFHCERPNGYGNLWIYVRVAGTTDYGWISKATVRNPGVIIAKCNP